MMEDQPVAASLDDNHGKTRGRLDRVTVANPGEFIKPGDQHRRVIQRNDAVIADSYLVAAAWQPLEIVVNQLGLIGDRWADGSEEDRIGRVELDEGLCIVRAEQRRPTVYDCVRILSGVGNSSNWGKHSEHGQNWPHKRCDGFRLF